MPGGPFETSTPPRATGGRKRSRALGGGLHAGLANSVEKNPIRRRDFCVWENAREHKLQKHAAPNRTSKTNPIRADAAAAATGYAAPTKDNADSDNIAPNVSNGAAAAASDNAAAAD